MSSKRPTKETAPSKTSRERTSRPAKRAAKVPRKAAKKTGRKRAAKKAPEKVYQPSSIDDMDKVIPFPDATTGNSCISDPDQLPAEDSRVQKVLALIRQLPAQYGPELMKILREHGPYMAEPHIANLARTTKKPALRLLFKALHYAIKALPEKGLR